MKCKFLIMLIFNLFFLKEIRAQVTLSGTVYDISTKTKLSNVLIRDTKTRQLAITGKSGNFKIQAAVNDLLIFTLIGYTPDTLYLVDLSPKKIELESSQRNLSEVKITGVAYKTSFNPRIEYPEVYEKSKFSLSPSRLLGREAKDARRLKRYFDNEIKQRQIDSIFNTQLVSGIIPLRGNDLNNFMVMYRPRLSFLNKSSPDELREYIKKNYQIYKQLTPEEQVLPRL